MFAFVYAKTLIYFPKKTSEHVCKKFLYGPNIVDNIFGSITSILHLRSGYKRKRRHGQETFGQHVRLLQRFRLHKQHNLPKVPQIPPPTPPATTKFSQNTFSDVNTSVTISSAHPGGSAGSLSKKHVSDTSIPRTGG